MSEDLITYPWVVEWTGGDLRAGLKVFDTEADARAFIKKLPDEERKSAAAWCMGDR